MAGGIDWFRWHHGSVTDPKFQLVARRSGASLPDVLAVWAYLLEKASAAEFRGCFGEIDCEAVDCLFGFDDGTTNAILTQMVDRSLIADEFVVAWDKRQPKRERENDSSTERVRAFRQKHSHETPCNATERQETPREEKRREEVNHSVANATGGKPPMSPDEIIFGYGVPLLVAAGSTDKAARSFLGGLRKHHGDDALINTLRDCLKAKPLQPTEWLAAALPPNGRPQARASPAAAREESRRAAGIGIFGNLEDEHGRTGRTFDITPAATFALGGPDFP